MPDGNVIDVLNINIGRVLSDGNVINNSGKLIGEVMDGDVVIDDADKVVGYVNFAGTVTAKPAEVTWPQSVFGLAVDNEAIFGTYL